MRINNSDNKPDVSARPVRVLQSFRAVTIPAVVSAVVGIWTGIEATEQSKLVLIGLLVFGWSVVVIADTVRQIGGRPDA